MPEKKKKKKVQLTKTKGRLAELLSRQERQAKQMTKEHAVTARNRAQEATQKIRKANPRKASKV